MRSSRDILVERCEAWLAETGLAESTLSKAILHVSDGLSRLRAGARIHIETFDAAMRWLDDNPPDKYLATHKRGRPPKSGNAENANAEAD